MTKKEAMTNVRLAQRLDRPLAMMVVLTFVTGMVDAVGYLGLDRVFTGNMTGNIVILGMGLAGVDELPVLGPAVALATFAAGAFATGLVLRSARKGWSTRITLVLVTGALALTGCACGLLLVPDDSRVQLTVAAITAAVMGAQATVARKVAVTDMTTVVVTSTLTQLASESFVAGGPRAVGNRRMVAIGAIFLGAFVGAVLLQVHIAIPMGLAAVLSLVVTGAGHRHNKAIDQAGGKVTTVYN